MNRTPCIITVIVLLLLVILLLFWHPLDSLKGTTDTKPTVTTVTPTPTPVTPAPVTPVAPTKPPVKQQPPVQKNNGGGTTTVIIKVVDATTGQPMPSGERIEVKTNPITSTSSNNKTTGSLNSATVEETIIMLNHDAGNHFPQLRFDELGSEEASIPEFPEAVWNNTKDGHNFRFYSRTKSITGDRGITEDGTIYEKASNLSRFLNNDKIVEVKGSPTHWFLKKMTLENVDGIDYYVLRTNKN